MQITSILQDHTADILPGQVMDISYEQMAAIPTELIASIPHSDQVI